MFLPCDRRCLTFAMKSLLEVVQDVREPPHIVNQLHHRLRVRSGGPDQVRRQRHCAQWVGVLHVSTHIPGLGGSCWQGSSVWLGVVFVQSLAALRPATAAVALPDHSSAARVLGWVTQVSGRWREQCYVQCVVNVCDLFLFCFVFFIKSLVLLHCDLKDFVFLSKENEEKKKLIKTHTTTSCKITLSRYEDLFMKM